MLFIYPDFQHETANTVFPTCHNLVQLIGNPHLRGMLESDEAGVDSTSSRSEDEAFT